MGRVLTELNVFTAIRYNEDNQLENIELYDSKNSTKNAKSQYETKRKIDEMQLHENLWNLLTFGDENGPVPKSHLSALLQILMSPHNYNVIKIAQLVKDLLTGLDSDFQAKYDSKKLDEFVRQWKGLQIDHLAHQRIGSLKPQ